MLTLTRKNNQAIIIKPSDGLDPNMTVAELMENPIEIVVHRIKSSTVALSVAAPKQLKVVRKELLD
jgi:sRNA-binding carbon storage regulator CsrA